MPVATTRITAEARNRTETTLEEIALKATTNQGSAETKMKMEEATRARASDGTTTTEEETGAETEVASEDVEATTKTHEVEAVEDAVATTKKTVDEVATKATEMETPAWFPKEAMASTKGQ